jgi:hypothetical protein
MRGTRLLLALVLTLLAAEAGAGAWPRDPRTGFLSVSNIPTLDRQGAVSAWVGLYAEYGLTRRVTLGLDADRRSTGDTWSAWAFARYDLAPGADVRRAVSLGIGLRGYGGQSEMVLRPGLHVGRGVQTLWGPGWLEAEAQAIHAPASGWTAWKLDGTFGVKPRPDRLLIVQLQTSQYPGQRVQVRLAPSFVRRLGPALSLEFGLTADLTAPQSLGAKLGTWLEF